MNKKKLLGKFYLYPNTYTVNFKTPVKRIKKCKIVAIPSLFIELMIFNFKLFC